MRVPLVLLLILAAASAQAQPTSSAILTPSDGAAGDFFGDAMATSQEGDVVLVGAPWHTEGVRSGAAYVFRRLAGGAWVEEAELTPGPDAREMDKFGHAVAVSEDGRRLLVGAPQMTTKGSQGAAYVFRYDGEPPAGAWVREARLTSTSPLPDLFGYGVALGGERAFVTAGFHEEVHVFRREEGAGGTAEWVLEAVLDERTLAITPCFGCALSVSEGRVLIGEPNGEGGEPGAAYVYGRTGTAWAREDSLGGSELSERSYLGRSVALVGGEAAVGAPGYGAPSSEGAVYVYRRVEEGGGVRWEERQVVRPAPSGEDNYGFGYAVAMTEDWLLAGRPYFGPEAYLYEKEGGEWVSSVVIHPEDGEDSSFSGSVALSQTYALVGSPGTNGGAGGRVYVYDLGKLVRTEALPEPSVDLRVFPNPSRGEVIVQFSVAAPGWVRVTLHDLLGRAVAVVEDAAYAHGQHRVGVDTDGIAAGVYAVRLSSVSGSGTALLSVIR